MLGGSTKLSLTCDCRLKSFFLGRESKMLNGIGCSIRLVGWLLAVCFMDFWFKQDFAKVKKERRQVSRQMDHSP